MYLIISKQPCQVFVNVIKQGNETKFVALLYVCLYKVFTLFEDNMPTQGTQREKNKV